MSQKDLAEWAFKELFLNAPNVHGRYSISGGTLYGMQYLAQSKILVLFQSGIVRNYPAAIRKPADKLLLFAA